MPHVASTSATSLALAHDRADRDRQVAADWRRRRTQPDAEPETAGTATHRSLRPILGGLTAALGMVRTRVTP